MQMMIENPRPETSETGQARSDMSQDKTLKDLVEALEDGDIISIPLEGMVISNG